MRQAVRMIIEARIRYEELYEIAERCLPHPVCGGPDSTDEDFDRIRAWCERNLGPQFVNETVDPEDFTRINLGARWFITIDEDFWFAQGKDAVTALMLGRTFTQERLW